MFGNRRLTTLEAQVKGLRDAVSLRCKALAERLAAVERVPVPQAELDAIRVDLDALSARVRKLAGHVYRGRRAEQEAADESADLSGAGGDPEFSAFLELQHAPPRRPNGA